MKFEIRIAFGRSGEESPAQAPPRRSADGKIGTHVRETMTRLSSQGRLRPPELARLLDGAYCKKTFRLSYPFLRKVVPGRDLRAQRLDERGYGRYWRDPIEIGGTQYLVCSQWFVWQREAFDRWARELG